MKYSYLIIVVMLFSCSKSGDNSAELAKLPPATETGANTCGCLVNGKAWVAKVPAVAGTQAYTIGPVVFMNLTDSVSTAIHFVLRGYEPAINKYYKINNGQGWSSASLDSCGYHSSKDLENISRIKFTKLDTVNRIMSGTFSHTFTRASATGSSCPVLKFTDCRFDLKYLKN